jgi:Fe-S cluster assembly protein SufD
MEFKSKISDISEEILNSLLKSNHEENWLIDRRATAFRRFLDTPYPTSRRMDYKNLSLNGNVFESNSDNTTLSKREDILSVDNFLLDKSFREKNSIMQTGGGSIKTQLDSQLVEKGIIYTTIREAIRTNPALFSEYFPNHNLESTDKFYLLNSALWQDGVFLYVPKNTRVDVPLTSLFSTTKENSIDLPFIILVADIGSEVTFIDYQTSQPKSINNFVSGAVNIFISQNAKVNYISIQKFNDSVNHFVKKRIELKRDSLLNWIEIVFGAKNAKNNLTVCLDESGAEAYVSGMFIAGKNQQMEFNTEQLHNSVNSKSDLLFVGALRENAHSSYEGLIRVQKGAQKTDAYQKNKNLLLSKEAKADSEPLLEIEANDVRCTHGATVGPIAKEDLFYLMSRGIPKPLATKLLVLGFFNKVLDKISVESIRASLETYIQEQVTE